MDRRLGAVDCQCLFSAQHAGPGRRGRDRIFVGPNPARCSRLLPVARSHRRGVAAVAAAAVVLVWLLLAVRAAAGAGSA